jgi:hypothetical protein
MKTLFENNDFILKSTGHDYDFVGIIETKTEEPLTFFFSEELVPHEESEEDEWDSYEWEDNIDESETELKAMLENLPDDADEVEKTAFRLRADSFFRTRDDRSTGFLSNPQERGQFLALIKHYCPEQLSQIAWA